MVKTFVVDLFCGAGGTTISIKEAETNIEVVVCINHDETSIKSHTLNNKNCIHKIEDIRTVAMQPLVDLINKLRIDNSGCKIALWASLECTNFSNAKSGPKNADSRTLAEHLFRYLKALDPDFLWIENVKEFKDWGPLDENGNPIKSRKGENYKKWIKKLTSEFFDKEWSEQILMSADYGGATIRERLFLQFAKDSRMIGVPTQTHSKYKNDGLMDWVPIRTCLDFSNKGRSIFNRKKKLVSKTHKRFVKGFLKHGHEVNCSFGIKYYGQIGTQDIEQPSGALTCKDRIYPVFSTPVMIKQNFGTSNCRSLNVPSSAITAVPKNDLVFVHNPQYGGSSRSVNQPSATLIARQDKAPLATVTGVSSADLMRISPITERYANDSDITELEDGTYVINIFFCDDLWMRYIKRYMYCNQLCDVTFRSLEIEEMLAIQGFPEGYQLAGTKTEQKKQVGNSVEVEVGKALISSIDHNIQKYSLCQK